MSGGGGGGGVCAATGGVEFGEEYEKIGYGSERAARGIIAGRTKVSLTQT